MVFFLVIFFFNVFHKVISYAFVGNIYFGQNCVCVVFHVWIWSQAVVLHNRLKKAVQIKYFNVMASLKMGIIKDDDSLTVTNRSELIVTYNCLYPN